MVFKNLNLKVSNQGAKKIINFRSLPYGQAEASIY